MALADDLRARIMRDGPIRSRDFMAACLQAYYAKGPVIGGDRGDFYTAANVSLFPHAMRRFIDAAVERLGVDGTRVIELGGGSGELASRLEREITIVEPSPALRAGQQARGLKVVASLDELAPAPTVVIANEVLDALPVHRVWMMAEGPREGYVAWRDGAFVEGPGPLSPGLADLIPPLDVGDKCEVNLEARDLLASLAKATTQCFALFLDYATDTPRDTLRGFRKHRVTSWLDAPGEQDVTADVDFALVARYAAGLGFDVLGPVPQSDLLGDLGLVDDLTAALERGDTEAYLSGKGLLMPGGRGERYRAIGLVRGAPIAPPPAGFRKDIYPGPSRR